MSAYAKQPLASVLTRVQDSVAIDPHETYKQVTVRLFHRGVVLRGEKLGSAIRTTRQSQVHQGQVLLSRIDARNGAIGIVPPGLEGAVVTNDFWAFEVNSEFAIPAFLDAYFGTAEFVDACKAASEGTTNRVRVQPERFLKVEVPLPSLDEQRRIVSRIEELSEKVHKSQGLRAQACEERLNLWQRAAEQLLDKSTRGAVRRLGDLVSLKGGGTPSKSNPMYWVGSIPWISPKDMKVRELYDSEDHISESATQETSAKLLDPNCVLIVVRGMILAHTVPAATLRVPAAINQDMKAMLPSEEILPDYLCTSIWALNPHLLDLIEKSTHDTRKLETEKLLDFAIPVPPPEKQKHLVSKLSKLYRTIEGLKKLQFETAAELDALMPSILSKAFRGEL